MSNLKKLDKRIRTIWIIRNMIVLLFLFIVYFSSIVLANKEFKMVMVIGFIIPVILCAILLIVWPFLSYNLYTYTYESKRIYINYGVIFRHKIVIPVCQIQDLHIYNGPIMSMFGISGVTISTAGSNFSIAGISSDDANKMVEELENLLQVRLEEQRHEEIH